MVHVIGKNDALTPSARVAALIIAGNFLQSISVGINAVIFTTALASYGAKTSTIGVILAVEYLSVFAISLNLPRILKLFSLSFGLEVSLLFRIPALIALCYVTEPKWWALWVFLHGVGNFLYGILLQTWINGLSFDKHKGLLMGLFGTSISLGLAIGPLLISFIGKHPLLLAPYIHSVEAAIFSQLGAKIPDTVNDITKAGLFLSAVFSAISAVPTLLCRFHAPKLRLESSTSAPKLISRAPAAFFAVMLCGFTILGLQSFITLYGIKNGLSVTAASYLMSAFMLGSIILEAPIASLSDRFDRRYVLIVLVLLGLVSAIYLPIAVYWKYSAWILLFVWGGMMGAIFSICLASISERFEGSALVAANGAFSIMDNLGGLLGVLVMGVAMDFFGEDGFPYALMLASVTYFSFALTRYRVQ
jgi:MFS family permease